MDLTLYSCVMTLASVFQTIFIAVFVKYEIKKIPEYKVALIEHNLESTPIYDILIGEKCEDYSKTSNILGYYFGYVEGFIFILKILIIYVILIMMIVSILELLNI